MNTIKSRALIVAAACMWGVIGVFYSELSSLGFHPGEVVFLRVLCAALLMTVVLLKKDRSLFRIRWKDLWMFFGMGIVSLACFNVCYFNAMNHMDLSVAATLLYTAPIFVMVFSAIFFRESFTAQKALAVAVTFAGCILITGTFTGSRISGIGLLFGIGSGVGYALYTIFGVVALKRYRTETVTFYTFWFAVLGVLPFCRWQEMTAIMKSSPMPSLLLTLGIGIICCLLPYIFYTKGLEHTPPSEASIMATLEPVVAAVVGWLFLGDNFAWRQPLGMALILGSIILIHCPLTKKSTDH